jgi:hexosaminidase
LFLCALLASQAAVLLPVWPAPTGPVSVGPSSMLVSPALAVTGAAQWPDVAAGVARFLERAFPHPTPPLRAARASAASISLLALVVANGSAPLHLGVDETYSLAIPAEAAAPITLTAATQFGALAGLETLSQLLVFDPGTRTYAVEGVPLSVEDAPVFAWRGLLVDTARHFQPLASLRAIIDSMAMAKLNVLHWHIVDAQSWPLESPSWPALWAGAFSPRERYTTDDVASIVAFARSRGVRVVFEVDHPGHLSSACKGYPALCPADCAWDAGANAVPLAPANNATWRMLADTLAELAALSPGEAFLHLGGDEVDATCWELDAATRAWVAATGLPGGVGAIYSVFVQRMNAAARALGRSPVRWEDAWTALGTALDPSTVIHVWLSPATLGNVTSQGYRALYSYQGVYDDVIGYQNGWYLNGLWQPWQQMYDVDLLAGLSGGGGSGNASARALVLGGEAAQWGEEADGSDVLQTIWPRAAAVAERLWSYNMALNSSDPGVAARLAGFRCLLLGRGVPATPLNALQGRSPPSGPGSCLTQ